MGFANDESELLQRFKQVNIVLDPVDDTKTQSTSAPGCYAEIMPLFAPRRPGNNVKFLSTGVEAFATMGAAIEAASEHVWIAGWQMAWDLELTQFGTGKNRLIDVLAAAVNKNVDVRVMLFKTFHDKPAIDDAYVANALRSVGVKVIRTTGQSGFQEHLYSYFAHHQKTVIVDRSTAFIGGLDLSYGRRDDADFAARADPDTRRMNEMYNACVPHTRALDEHQRSLASAKPASPSAARGIIDDSPGLLDFTSKPRQPWQDTHLRIRGPSAFDIACNFIRRWNGLVESDNDVKIQPPPMLDGEPSLPVTPVDYYISRAGSVKLEDYSPDTLASTGSMTVQILRSTSPKEMANEYRASRTPINLLGELTSTQKASRQRQLPARSQINVQDAMIRAILGAQHFLYIENQYFVSHHGEEQSVDDQGNVQPMSQVKPSPELLQAWGNTSEIMKVALRSGTEQTHEVSNLIVAALGQRIRAAVLAGERFHVYLMMPLHSEGLLSDVTIMGQMHLAMQTLTFGSKSLINLIKHAILEKDYAGTDVLSSMDGRRLNEALWDVAAERWQKYLTLLYSRTYDLLPNGMLVTEQVYVHSKCLIADDRIAIVGSANINDRSLMGDRDTEIAALVLDGQNTTTEMIDGKNEHRVRVFARDLRIALWRKHFGLSKANTSIGPPAAADLEGMLDKPAAPATILAIQNRATANSSIYEKVFDWVPRNSDPRRLIKNKEATMGSSVWPGWILTDSIDSDQPWSNNFKYPAGLGASAKLSVLNSEIKGFWCAYPHLWMQGQNNLSSHISLELISRSEPSDSLVPSQTWDES